jgi:PEP-CTERM motif
MRTLAVSRALLAACLVVTSLAAGAAVIAQRDGVSRQGYIAAPSVVSFTTSDTFANVSIEAKIDACCTAFGDGIVYLTTSVGPGTTIADEIANVALTGIPFHPDATTVGFLPLFSGLTLTPDTYYLVLFSGSPIAELRWLRDFDSLTRNETTASGVTIGNDFAHAGAPAGYPPATALSTVEPWQLFRVTGDLVGRVPEPGSVALLGLALLAWAVRRHPAAAALTPAARA